MQFLIPASRRRPFRNLKKSAHLELSSLWAQTGAQQAAAVNAAIMTLGQAFRNNNYAEVFRTVLEVVIGDGTSVPVELISANTQLHSLNQETREFAHGYEPEIAAIIDAFVPDNGTMIDAGANFGYFSIFLICRPNFTGQIHAFEPSSRGFRDLLTFLAHVDHLGQIRPYRLALGNRQGTLTLHQGQSDGLSTTVLAMANRAERVETSEDVPVRRLDDLSIHSVDLIKIDVEGAELQVLEGADSTLRTCRPAVVFESWLSYDDSGVFAILKDLGYFFFVPGWDIGDGNITTAVAKAIDITQLTAREFQPEQRAKLPERVNILALPRERKDQYLASR
jgi:FkbM family methyltransferase